MDPFSILGAVGGIAGAFGGGGDPVPAPLPPAQGPFKNSGGNSRFASNLNGGVFQVGPGASNSPSTSGSSTITLLILAGAGIAAVLLLRK